MSLTLPILAFPPAVRCKSEIKILLFIGLTPEFISSHVTTAPFPKTFSASTLTKRFNASFGAALPDATQWMVGYTLMADPNEWDIAYQDIIDAAQQSIHQKGKNDLLVGEGCIKNVGVTEFKEHIYDWKQHWTQGMDFDENFYFELSPDGLRPVGSTSEQQSENAVLHLMQFVTQ
jgi:hypothetical protein